MEAFNVVIGKVAPMLAANIDTDVIMPKQFLKGIDRKGLDRGVFFDQRFLESGDLNPDFVLNRTAWRGAKFLAVGPNFGCGSSREHAPWALLDFGIRVVISTSFADIFYNNCFKNGILPIIVDSDTRDDLLRDAENGSNARITVDLENQEISRPNGVKVSFFIDEYKKHCLTEGLDDIAVTLDKKSEIDSFEITTEQKFPWL